jgi:uncharacterized protein YyaL (SSP411 family)
VRSGPPAGRSSDPTMPNRLAEEKSPYLLQHAGNPVAWQPWDERALRQAKEQDRPIFLSIGYATCHWCHVMARQSFESEETARLLNDHFVSIKVDREERPDLDRVYMTAVNLLSGTGGWPLSAFLLPDGRPFLGGTYFTPGRFRKLLSDVTAAYAQRRDEVEKVAAQATRAAADSFRLPAPQPGRPAALEWSLVESALGRLASLFDAESGGFGGAPKFPPHTALALMGYVLGKRADPSLTEVVTKTLDAMAAGGIHDHVGGGFHRYATDADWRVPHFEKMLYDNALLGQAYVEGYRLTGEASYRQVAEGIHAWVTREMIADGGGFCCALDAESEGEEGRYYTWTRDEVLATLGPEDAELFCRVYHVEPRGNYREEAGGRPSGRNIPSLTLPIDRLAPDQAQFGPRLAAAREKLRAAREQRPRPFRDDKVLASWNGLMIGSLARAARLLEEPEYARLAERAAGFVRDRLWQEGRLWRRWRDGEAKHAGFLDDYAYLANGLLDLHEVAADDAVLAWAEEVMERATAEFAGDVQGGLFYTGAGGEQLFVRPRHLMDDPLPASEAAAVQALLRLAEHTGEQQYALSAERHLLALRPVAEQRPHGAESISLAVAMYLNAEPKRSSAA